MADPIAFHYDFISPYAYLAWTQIHALAARHGRSVLAVPTLFAALLSHGQTKGPAEIPAKRRYMFVDVLRSASVLEVPLSPPPSHPFNPLVALRAASLELEGKRRLVDALFAGAWGGGPGVDTAARVAQVATEAGFDGESIVRLASEDRAKQRLREQTDAAISKGIFGVPTMVVDQEMFWGLESFPHLERHLRGEPMGFHAELSRWANLPATATRA